MPGPDRWQRAVQLRVLDAALAAEPACGPWASCRGIELPLLAALDALRPDDWFFGEPRTAAVAWLRGQPLPDFLGQVFGGGASAGHAAPGELSFRAGNVVSTSSLMGTQLPHAGGVAHAMRARGADTVALAVFGPAAAATGDAHCAFNFAGVFRQPVVFVYLGTSDAGERLGGTFVDRAEGYGLAAESADADDPAGLDAAIGVAVARARQGGGSLVEVRPARGDVLDTLAPPAARRSLEARFGAEVRAALATARTGPLPPLDSLFDDVLAQPDARHREQREAARADAARRAAGADF